MTDTESTYRSIFLKIGTLPASYLQQLDAYLQVLLQESEREKRANRKSILALAGCWDDMSEDSFNEYLDVAKNTGKEIFQD